MNIFIADDEPKLRRGLEQIIARMGRADWLVCGTAGDGASALEQLERLAVDVLFVDIKMPGMSGLELIERVRATDERMAILVISGFAQFEYAQEAIRYGISEYIVKPLDPIKVEDSLCRAALQLKRADRIAGRAGISAGGEQGGGGAASEADPLLAELAAMKERCSAVVLQAVGYVRANFGHNIRLDDIAGHVFVHPHYLSELFKKETGRNLSDFLTDYRIMMSKQELCKPGAKIYAVASQVGFNDPKYFSQVFRKRQGISPVEYRAQYAKAAHVAEMGRE